MRTVLRAVLVALALFATLLTVAPKADAQLPELPDMRVASYTRTGCLLAISVANFGNASTNGQDSDVRIESPLPGNMNFGQSLWIQPLAIDQIHTRTFNLSGVASYWPAFETNNQLTITADFYDTIYELDDLIVNNSNNAVTISVPTNCAGSNDSGIFAEAEVEVVTQPDLAFSNVVVATSGTMCGVVAYATNQGDAAADPAEVVAVSGTSQATYTTPTMAAGTNASAALGLASLATASTPQTVTITLDANLEVDESDESNNTYTVTVAPYCNGLLMPATTGGVDSVEIGPVVTLEEPSATGGVDYVESDPTVTLAHASTPACSTIYVSVRYTADNSFGILRLDDNGDLAEDLGTFGMSTITEIAWVGDKLMAVGELNGAHGLVELDINTGTASVVGYQNSLKGLGGGANADSLVVSTNGHTVKHGEPFVNSSWSAPVTLPIFGSNQRVSDIAVDPTTHDRFYMLKAGSLKRLVMHDANDTAVGSPIAVPWFTGLVHTGEELIGIRSNGSQYSVDPVAGATLISNAGDYAADASVWGAAAFWNNDCVPSAAAPAPVPPTNAPASSPTGITVGKPGKNSKPAAQVAPKRWFEAER